MSEVDLTALRIDPTAPGPGRRRPGGGRWIAITVAMIVLALATTFVAPWFQTVRSVRTAPVLADRTDLGHGSDSASFAAPIEAAGWIEPEPWPTSVRALVPGIIQSLHVVEGDTVIAEETVIARLHPARFDAAVERAIADEANAITAVTKHSAAVDVARAIRKQLAQERTRERGARHAVDVSEARLQAARAQLSGLEADLASARLEQEAQEALAAAGGQYPLALKRARLAVEAAHARTDAQRESVRVAERELHKDRDALTLAEELLASPSALDGEVTIAAAALASAEAALSVAQVARKIAEQERTYAEILAPASGTVMAVDAAPGDAAGPDGHAIARIYDPARLQARVDVPLGEVSGLRTGQSVRLQSDVTGDLVLHGTLARIQRSSDLLKNTLQVKVQIDPPPADLAASSARWNLVPETLVRAKFLATDARTPGATPSSSSNSSAVADQFRVPSEAVRDGRVFVIDPRHGGRARAVQVTIVAERDGMSVVRGALSVTHRAILDPVEDDDRVKELLQ